MKFFLFIFSLFIFIYFLRAETESLQLVHVFFRHGSRTPELKDTYPTDPYDLETFLPMGWGALTNAGKEMSFKLGKLLRRRYDSFLGDIYTPELIEGTSTDYDRTKMTLLLVLAGLFPPSSSQMWSDSLSWLPIPINYDKSKYDYSLRRPTFYCPAYVKELEKVLASQEVKDYIQEHSTLFEYLEENTKKPMKTLLNVFHIYQNLNAQDNMNLTLPEWAKSVYPDQIHAVAGHRCYYENFSPLLKKLNGGRMLSKVINNMVEKSKDKLLPAHRKIYLYSGHENNVLNILAALNLFKPHVPKYTAATIVELHYVKEKGNYAVKVFYLRDYNNEPELQKLENCDTLCPLSDFIKLTENHVPLNYTADCESSVNLD